MALTACASAVIAAGAPGGKYVNSNNVLTVSQLKRGMTGYGLTVFQGTKIEKFNVEILGVLSKVNNGKDYILARFSGGPLSVRGMGVAQGMSGSPVYINGRLVGAVSAAMQWCKEPIGMITPIMDMVESLDDNLPKHATGYSSTSDLNEPTVVEGKSYRSISVQDPADTPSKPEDGVMQITPLATPVMVSGIPDSCLPQLRQILKPFNVAITAGAGGGARDMSGINPKLEPGAAVGVSLISGDIDMTATGTVTYVNGNRLVAFGHPFMSVGAVDAPMTTAYILDVMASYSTSTKLACPLKTVGRIFQDRPWSVAGLIGNFPKMIPVKVSVDDETTKRVKTFNVKIINHPMLAAQLSAMVVNAAIEQVHSTPGDATATLSYAITADQLGAIKRSNIFFDQAAIASASMPDITNLLRILSTNVFQPLDIKGVDVKVTINNQRNTATIDRIFVKKSEYAPGDTVDVGVVLRPYKKERITKYYSIKIPATAPEGKIMLQVKGGSSPEPAVQVVSSPGGEGEASMVAVSDSGFGGVDNVKQLVNKYLEKERNNQIVVQLMMPSGAVNIAGEKLSGLPASIADVMKSSRNSGLRIERDEVKKLFDENMIVTGTARLNINVKEKNFDENKPASTGAGQAAAMISAPMTADPGLDASLMLDDMSIETAAASSDDLQADAPAKVAPAKARPAPSRGAKQPEAKPGDTKPADAKPAETPAPKSEVKTVVRQAQVWSQRLQSDFAKGTFMGVAASSENKLEITPTLQKLAETSEQYVWSVAPAKDGVYAGTGNSGKVLFISNTGEVKTICSTGELEVQSLTRDIKGNIYAGTAPNGKVFKITTDGKSTMVLKADERYIIALTSDMQGNVYAAVGDAGKIYKITPEGKSSVFSTINEQQVLSLCWDKKGDLIAGTGINGVVYRISNTGAATPIFDASESAITAVTSDSHGNIYAGTSPKGVVYKISPDGRSKSIYTAPAKVLAMAVDVSGNIFAVSDTTLVKITPDETVTQLDTSKESAQYLAMAYNGATGALYAGTGNIGAIYVSKQGENTGTFESVVHDTKVGSMWGKIKWIADVPEGTSVILQTRSGNVDTPDASWSAWSRPYTSPAGEQISDNEARYIQYRVTLNSKSGITPRVSGVSISYMTPNQQPTVKLTEPLAGAVLSGTKSIKWSGSDPDKDKLTYDVYYSKDYKQWIAIVGGNTTTSEEKKLSTKDIVGKVRGEVEKSADIPDDMKKPFTQGQDTGFAATAIANSSAGQSLAATSFDWDTTKVEDGAYYIKVVASDRASNATGALTDDNISDPIVVCNTTPVLALASRKDIEVKGSGVASLKGTVESKMVDIVGVQFRIDGGDWMAAAADDGVFDSQKESFTATSGTLTPGSHKLEIQAIDAAGNSATDSVEIKAS